MTMKKTATYYIKKCNLPIIPCIDKRPYIKEWQQRTATSISELEEWFTKMPSMNIGLVLGKASQIIGIDIDGDEAMEELRSWANGDLPKTWTFSTPGGLRMLYRAPQNITLKKHVKRLPGEHCELALLGDGQQTIMPPSIVEGKSYVWVKDLNPKQQALADAPKWMIKRMQDGASKHVSNSAITANVQENKIHETVFNRLASKCSLFNLHLQEQKKEGVSEEEWHSWTRLLTNAQSASVATSFSLLSLKHDKRSEERLRDLAEKKTAAMVRCTSFGCSLEQIEKCHGKLNKNDADEVTNSPGNFIQSNGASLSLPTSPIYQPYLDALEDIADYTLNESGCLTSFDTKGNPVELANFVARATQENIRDDGEDVERTYQIEGVLHSGKPLPPIEVKLEDFLAMKWPTENWGIEVSFKPGYTKKDLCRDAIQNMAKDIQKNHIFTHVGWRKTKNGKWVYLHADGCIGHNSISIDIEKELRKYTLPKPTDISDPVLAAKNSFRLLELANTSVTIPLLALVYLAPLTDAFRRAHLEPTFLVWLHGTTGSRKTTLAQLFLSHFGTFSGQTPPASFKDTANNIERKAFSTKDTLLLIDDYHPEASRYEAQKMTNIAQRVLRMYGDRIGRGRLKSTTEYQKTYVPRGMALVTGEDIPTGESTIARFFEAELTKGDVDLALLTEMQNNVHLLSESMVGYLQWLAPKMDDLPDVLKAQFETHRDYFMEHAAHGRQGSAAAWLLTAFDFMLDYHSDIGTLESEEIESYSEQAKTTLLTGIKKQNKLVEQERPEEIFLKAISILFDLDKVHVNPLKATSSISVTENPHSVKIGWYDSDTYYFLPDITFNLVKKHLLSMGENFPVSEKVLWKHLEQANMIDVEKDANGKVTHRLIKKTISKASGAKKAYRPRLLHVHAHYFEEN